MDILWTKSNTCRICLQKCDNLNSLESFSGFVFMDLVLDVNKELLQYTDVPDKCCTTCEAELKASQDFKLKCDYSNEILIKYYERIPTLLIDLKLVEEEIKTETDVVENNLLNTNIYVSNEPVIDHNKRFARDFQHEAENKKFKSFAFSQEKVVVDVILESKLKTLSVKEIRDKNNPENLNQISKSSVDKNICEICNFVAPYPSALSRHIRTHTTELPFSCELCAKTFSNISTLSKHKFSHSDDAQFICDVCEKQFTFRMSLVEHMSTHSSETFLCDTCKKVFNSKYNLELHARRHMKDGQFACDICGKRRVSKHSLDIHKRVHSGQQQFACQDCSYKTVSKAGLQIHQRTHSGETPFCCPQCPDSFISGLQMTRHLIKKHRKPKLTTDSN